VLPVGQRKCMEGRKKGKEKGAKRREECMVEEERSVGKSANEENQTDAIQERKRD